MINEQIWKKAEANQVMRERRRLFKLGRLKPVRVTKPNVLVKDENGNWKLPLISAA